MAPMVRFHLDRPLPPAAHLLVVAFDGWTDAGQAGTLAAQALLDHGDAERLGAFDPDDLYDYRARRPLLHIADGTLGELRWPSLELSLLRSFPDVLVLTGAEPDLNWRALIERVVGLVGELGLRRYIGFGAVPAPVPHTRPTPVTVTATDPTLRHRWGAVPTGELVVPASCQVLIERSVGEHGTDAVGLWARIPHYIAGEYPAGAVALLERFAEITGLVVDRSALVTAAESHRRRLDAAAAGSPEISAHIRQLEDIVDGEPGISGPLPSGEEIAAEFERYLREQGGDGS